MQLSAASERVIFLAVENRLAKIDALIDATHASMDATQREIDALTRQVWQLEARIDLLEEWARVRFEELARERS